ncbi:MAG: Holliday junction resolvase RuvX [Oscillospiraceae bacterium]|jgi:putative Holliday junction resolvase|nr:Holliday junction resolvase RuvX [Oscillospiraceae bacterium]
MRVMAIDYGDVRTGLAVSDAAGTLTGDAFVIRETAPQKLAAAIVREAEARGVEGLVLGWPRNMDGSLGPRAAKADALAVRLRRLTDIPLALWDERRTTVEAQRILHTVGRHGAKNKGAVDAVAAALILEGYLAARGRQDKMNNE